MRRQRERSTAHHADVPAPKDALCDGGPVLARDREWAPELRSSLVCSVALFALLLLIDVAGTGFDALRTLCWAGLGLLLFAVLLPPRVTAGDGWLAVRGLLREKRVRTDALTGVRRAAGTAPRIVLRDAGGNRIEFDPHVLIANPLLWHELDRGARRSREHGLLDEGQAVLADLAERVDGSAVRALLEQAGLA